MNGCGIDLDPNTVQRTIDVCVQIIEQPSSPANLFRGILVVSLLGLVVVTMLLAITRGRVA